MYLDADILFALIKPSDRHQAFAEEVLTKKERLYTSFTTLLELEIVVKREISDDLSMNIMEALQRKVPELEIVSNDTKTFTDSLTLRKKYGVGIFDAIHAATALHHDKRIASTDHIYNRIKGLHWIKPTEKEK